VAISGFVALTLTPALGARVLRPHGEERGFKRALSNGFDKLAAGYDRVLGASLARPSVAVAIGLAWVGLGVAVLYTIDREFVPASDRGSFLSMIRAPEGSTLEYTARYQKQLDEIVRAIPEVQRSFSVVSLGLGTPGLVNEGAMFTTLVPWEDRDRSSSDIVKELRDKYAKVPGVKAFPFNPAALGRSFRSAPVSMVVQGPDIVQLARYANEIVKAGEDNAGLVSLQSDLVINKPQLEVEIDRNRASDLRVSPRDIATTLQILLGGLDLSTFKLGGETYNVIVQLESQNRSDPLDVLRAYVKNPEGNLIPLSSVVSVRQTVAPRGLPHFDRLRSATITANLKDGASLGTSLDDLRDVAEGILPAGSGYRVRFSGESEQFYESSNALLFAYVLAVVAVYLVLAAQFESFLHPAVILVAVALSFTGALVTLRLTGTSLNLFSQIGLVMLVGLVTKNSILIVEFANQLRARGSSVRDAVFEAARIRFRPILMTALATIAGILPIALGLGAGGEARAPLGIAVVGGVGFATILTFVVVPAIYLVVVSASERAGRAAKSEPEAAEARPAIAGGS
jgi:multidrug efflux pump